MRTARREYLGIKMSKEENQAIIRLAKHKGLDKSTLARSILVEYMTAKGALVYKTNPVVVPDDSNLQQKA
ncbi:MAG: hypothetical protein HY865_00885 [Chloroflexi bacterium]|nr:hypothetical protein [Chloroflexota bacterium]